jgi:hypothetical protein
MDLLNNNVNLFFYFIPVIVLAPLVWVGVIISGSRCPLDLREVEGLLEAKDG